MKLPVMTLGQAKKLAGKRFRVGGKEFVFDNDIKAGGQAIAIPLKNDAGEPIAFFRSLVVTGMTQPNIERISWLIGQKLHLKSEAFIGVPQFWVNTESQGRPVGIDFDFTGTIHGLALGTTWKSWKEDMVFDNRNEPGTALRLKFSKGLIQRLACLESVGRSGFVHGDLSDANVMLDEMTGKVSLIDFDCFIFESPSLTKPKLLVREGGSKGTPGYIPDWLRDGESTDLAPLGDRFSRDILLIELLGFRAEDLIDASPLHWSEQDELLDSIRTLAVALHLDHLQNMRVFEASESERPSSFELANRLGLPIDNNVQQSLSAEPVMPHLVVSPEKPRQNEKVTDSEAPVSASPAFQMPSLEELPQFLKREADRTAIAIGKLVLPLTKSVLRGVVGIALTVMWVVLVVWLLLNVSVPANLILCGVTIYLTVVVVRNPELLKKHFRQ